MRKFLTAQAAGGVNARPGLVDDHVAGALVFQFRPEQFSDEVLRLAAGRAVADDNRRKLKFLDPFHDPLLGLLAAFGLAHQEHHVVRQDGAELVQGNEFAAALEARIDGQNAAVADGRLQQKIAQILGEDPHGVGLRAIGQLAAHFALQAGEDKPGERIPGTSAEEGGMRMLRRNAEFLHNLIHRLDVAVELHAEHAGTLAAVDGQHAVRRDLLDLLGIVVVIGKSLLLPLFGLLLLLFLLLAFQVRLGRLPFGLDRRLGRSARLSLFRLHFRLRVARSHGNHIRLRLDADCCLHRQQTGWIFPMRLDCVYDVRILRHHDDLGYDHRRGAHHILNRCGFLRNRLLEALTGAGTRPGESSATGQFPTAETSPPAAGSSTETTAGSSAASSGAAATTVSGWNSGAVATTGSTAGAAFSTAGEAGNPATDCGSPFPLRRPVWNPRRRERK